MKKFFGKTIKLFVIVMMMTLLCSAAVLADETAGDTIVDDTTAPIQPQVRILFVGNSSTYYNNMPNMVKGLATAAGQNVYIESITASSYKLHQFADETNVNGAKVYEALKSNKWDYVILQDHRDMIISNLKKTVAAVEKLNPYIQATGAELILYETQSDYIGKSFSGDGFSYFLSNDEMQYYMTKGYYTVGNRFGARIATSGVNFERCMTEYPEIELYNKDYIHPSATGSYLAACTIYGAIFETSAFGNEYLPGSEYDTENLLAKVTKEDALKIQKIADPVLKLDKYYIEVNKGDSGTIAATLEVTEGNETLDNYLNIPKFSSLNDTAVSVNKSTGVFNAFGVGESLILASTDSGVLAMCTVNVKQPATAFVIEETGVKKMYKGDTITYTAKMSPSDTTDSITWKSSDEKVAIVDSDGTVTAKSVGVAKITAKTTSGIKVTRQVRVKLATPKIKKVKKLKTKAKGKKYANISIKWKKNKNAVKYYVYRLVNGKYKKIATTTNVTYIDKNRKKGRTYTYKVKAVFSNRKCNSVKSEAVSITLKK